MFCCWCKNIVLQLGLCVVLPQNRLEVSSSQLCTTSEENLLMVSNNYDDEVIVS